MDDRLLQALCCRNRGRPPVWIMRQAGRSLPRYRLLRQTYTLSELFFTPELAAKITLLPVEDLRVDAAILFSDITVVVKALGLHLSFEEGIGPVIEPIVNPYHKWARVAVADALQPIIESIRLSRAALTVPLIGFCGGPFTVACYILNRKRGKEPLGIREWMIRFPKELHALLDQLVEISCEYLDLQIEAGVHAIQIFESWGHLLSFEEFRLFCLPYHQRLIQWTKEKKIPTISFMRKTGHFISELLTINPDALSCDWLEPLATLRPKVGPSMALQGNLNPELLLQPSHQIEKEVKNLLKTMGNDPGFILNLGHGILPETSIEATRFFIDIVRSYQ